MCRIKCDLIYQWFLSVFLALSLCLTHSLALYSISTPFLSVCLSVCLSLSFFFSLSTFICHIMSNKSTADTTRCPPVSLTLTH
ncbi:hypothetical protein J4Q44_G00005100 [Coregonus suidteri]|uniref:Uncharacterized protein n=1 Tax=Coregonus suidteri TaxID=861788 RepID=A0AAN8MMK4_9TELE